jgi:hypothetical protein
MARFDDIVNHEAAHGNRTLPDFVITLPMADEGAPALDQDCLYPWGEIVSHFPPRVIAQRS